MESCVLAAPILPGKIEDWRRFCQVLLGSRRSQYEASRRRLGIAHEQAWLTQTATGGLAIVYLEADAPDEVLGRLAASDVPFDGWLRQQLLDLHGVDVTEGCALPVHERIFDWQLSQ
jgi:hypothetical protein